jgi:hypothetical protein
MWLDDTGLVRSRMERAGIVTFRASDMEKQCITGFNVAKALAFAPMRGVGLVTQAGALLAMAFANYWATAFAGKNAPNKNAALTPRTGTTKTLQALEERWSQHISGTHPDLVDADLCLRESAIFLAWIAHGKRTEPETPADYNKRVWSSIMLGCFPIILLMADSSIRLAETTKGVSGVAEAFLPVFIPGPMSPSETSTHSAQSAPPAATPAAAAQ